MGQVDQSWLWNRIMGHINFDNLVKISKKQVVRDMPTIVKPSYHICKHCQHGKQTGVTFKTNEHSTQSPCNSFILTFVVQLNQKFVR